MPDQEPLTERPIQRRIDETAGDLDTLVDMGAAEPPPEPSPA